MHSIGFIDHYLNNFHANSYLQLLREGRFRDQLKVTCAYGEVPEGGVDSPQWCEERGVELCASPEEVVARSDFVIVLSPNNPERHWELAEAALASGKRCYVDKTFAPDYATARRMITLAEESGTPMFTTSALRYVPQIHEFLDGVGREHPARAAVLTGPSNFDIYAIHCAEPLVMLLGTGAEQIAFHGTEELLVFTVRYADGRFGMWTQFVAGHPFQMSVLHDEGGLALAVDAAKIFGDMVDSIAEFLLGGPSPAPFAQTLEVMALLDAGRRAMAAPGEWIALPR